MTTLVLIRHAHAEPTGRDDHGRRLTAVGEARCALIRDWLNARRVRPDRVLISTALRAVQTWDLCSVGDVRAVPDERLYTADVAALGHLVASTAAGQQTLVIVGHNPTLEQYAWQLDDSPRAREVTNRPMAPGAVAVFEFGAWSQPYGTLSEWC